MSSKNIESRNSAYTVSIKGDDSKKFLGHDLETCIEPASKRRDPTGFPRSDSRVPHFSAAGIDLMFTPTYSAEVCLVHVYIVGLYVCHGQRLVLMYIKGP